MSNPIQIPRIKKTTEYWPKYKLARFLKQQDYELRRMLNEQYYEELKALKYNKKDRTLSPAIVNYIFEKLDVTEANV